MTRFLTTALLALLIVATTQSALAETFMMEPLPASRSTVGIRFLKPDFAGDPNLEFFSAAYLVYANVPVSDRLNVVACFPFVRADFEQSMSDGFFTIDDDQGIGNIFLGVQVRTELDGGGLNGTTVGVFLPTAPDDLDEAAVIGLGAEGWFRLPRYAPETTTAFVNNSYRSREGDGFFWGVEGGIQLMFPKGGEGEGFVRYGLRGGVQAEPILLQVEFLGSLLATGDSDEIGEQLSHGLCLGGRFVHAVVRPGVFYLAYIDEELDRLVNGVFGVDVSFVFP